MNEWIKLEILNSLYFILTDSTASTTEEKYYDHNLNTKKGSQSERQLEKTSEKNSKCMSMGILRKKFNIIFIAIAISNITAIEQENRSITDRYIT